MAIYSYKCFKCEHVEEKIVKFEERLEQKCSKCGSLTDFQLSMKFNGHGLPNGFSSTRSKTTKK